VDVGALEVQVAEALFLAVDVYDGFVERLGLAGDGADADVAALRDVDEDAVACGEFAEGLAVPDAAAG
jgi:hypothetical protein